MNVLYSGLDSLKVIESLPDETYDFIFLDPPYFTGSEFMFDSGSGSIRHMLSKEKGIPFKDVSLEEVEAEENRQRLAELKKYSDYIAKIIENAFRLLNPDGILAFLSPGKEYIDINYRLMLDQFFKSSKIITIERQAIPISGGSNNDDRLYFYAKSSNFVFPVLEEPRPIEDFKEQDDYDYYHKRDAFRHGIARPNFVYEWHGITPGQNSSWAYDKPKMNQLFDENRVLIDGNRVWIKQYRSEHLIPVSSVWKAKDNTRCRFAIDTLSLSRMFNMFVKSDSKILCPFDRGGKFSWLADSYGACWTSVHIPSDARSDLIAEIPVDHYSVITEISDETARQYTNTVITNVSDISALQSQLDQLSADIRKIQFSVGIIGDPEASVDAVIDQIHQHITELAGIKSSREYAENIRKVTNNLSAWQKTLEARLMGMYDKTLSAADSSAILNDAMIFIVAGEALFEMFVVKREYPLSDYGCIAIEYYKALEYHVEETVRKTIPKNRWDESLLTGHPWEIIYKYASLLESYNPDERYDSSNRRKIKESVRSEKAFIIDRIIDYGDIEYKKQRIMLNPENPRYAAEYEKSVLKLWRVMIENNCVSEKEEVSILKKEDVLSTCFTYMYH